MCSGGELCDARPVFGLFEKRPRTLAGNDLVYATAHARDEALVVRCLRDDAAGRRVVVVTAFADRAARVAALLTGRGVEASLLDGTYRSAGASARSVVVTPGVRLATAVHSFAQGEPVAVIVTERHPLRAHDDAVDAIASKLPRGSAQVYLLSLDDGLFTAFAPGIKDLMRKLDMPEDEAIEHSMVSKSIANAQAKVAARATGDVEATSFEGWWAANMPRG